MNFSETNQRVLVNNMSYPGFLPHLAKQLGIRTEALVKLGVGYLPVVHFKRSTNYDGQYTFPMRDATGKIIGFGLRNSTDGRRKTAIMGGKNGLFFAPGTTQKAFLDQWARLKDHGLTCPICGKDDWCLVDAEDTDNPAAVICSREESPRGYGEAGWLHILDDRWVDPNSNLSILPADAHPVLVFEGATDTAAAMSLGFVAVGRPSNTGGMQMLATLLLGRDVVIVGENDDAGLVGAEKTKEALTDIARTVRMVFPPMGIKDMREWLQTGVSREAVEEYIEKHAGSMKETTPSGSLKDEEPKTLAMAYLKMHDEYGASTLRYGSGDWYTYTPLDGWQMHEEAETMKNSLCRWMQDQTYTKRGNTTTQLKDVSTTNNAVSNVVGNIKARVSVAGDMPLWCDRRRSPDPTQMLVFKNGRLSVDAYLQGDFDLEDNDPQLFTTSMLPYAYAPEAKCPRWEQWLEETLGDDPLKIDLLQEWFGYNLIPDTRHEKILIMVGGAASGKSTATGVLRQLLGNTCAASSLRNFGSHFGLHSLMGKLAVILPDARMPSREQHQVTQTVLEISGNDQMEINRKYKGTTMTRLGCRITIASNVVPQLPSESDALKRRIMFIRFNQSFMNNPDINLKRVLKGETAGIIQWALLGLARLNSGLETFTVTSTQTIDEDRFQDLTNPVAEFVKVFLFNNPGGGGVEYSHLFLTWQGHCRERQIKVGTQVYLIDQLCRLMPGAERDASKEGSQALTKILTGIGMYPHGTTLANKEQMRRKAG